MSHRASVSTSQPEGATGEVEPSTLSILMPVFNERRTVESAIEAVLTADLPVESRELIVVNDGSTDGTQDILTSRRWPSEVKIHSLPANSGKGAAIRTGLQEASGTYTTIMDADLEYDAANLRSLIEPLLAGEVAVFGTRGFQAHSSYSFWYVVGNKAVTLTANFLFNSWVGDLMTCHKAIRTDIFRSLSLRAAGFAIEPEITAELLKSGVRIYEVPVSYHARSREQGKKLTALDGLRVMQTLFRCRFG